MDDRDKGVDAEAVVVIAGVVDDMIDGNLSPAAFCIRSVKCYGHIHADLMRSVRESGIQLRRAKKAIDKARMRDKVCANEQGCCMFCSR